MLFLFISKDRNSGAFLILLFYRYLFSSFLFSYFRREMFTIPIIHVETRTPFVVYLPLWVKTTLTSNDPQQPANDMHLSSLKNLNWWANTGCPPPPLFYCPVIRKSNDDPILYYIGLSSTTINA